MFRANRSSRAEGDYKSLPYQSPCALSPTLTHGASAVRVAQNHPLRWKKWLERPTPHAFATTTNSGTRRFGFVIGWVETLSASAGDALALVLLASTPIEWLYFEVLQLAHERIAGATGAAGVGRLPAVADARVAPLLEALLRTITLPLARLG